jgi:Zn-dependent protease with chaperone function
MRYVQRDLGDAADASSGGGRRGLGREIAVLAALTIGLISALFFGMGAIAGWAAYSIPVEQEARFFGKMDFGEGALDPPPSVAPAFARAEAILERFKREAPGVVELPYRLVYNPADEPNALAYPGGTIAVTRGLLESLGAEEDEIGLAFVIGHELGHFAHRHHLRSLGHRLGFGAAVMLIFGNLDVVSEKATQIAFLKYSRDQEREADDFGIAAVTAVYGRLNGAERLFEILSRNDLAPGWAYMLTTHPGNAERIEHILEEQRESGGK